MRKIFTLLSILACSFPLFAEEAPKPTGSTGGYMQSLIMILLAVVFFYFILWRPEQKRRKAQQKQRESLKAGDKVTAMGILGTIDSVEENTIILKNIDGSKMEILKAAVTEVKSEGAEKTVSMGKK
jgi:preprotein translocase subunit YajC